MTGTPFRTYLKLNSTLHSSLHTVLLPSEPAHSLWREVERRVVFFVSAVVHFHFFVVFLRIDDLAVQLVVRQ